MLPPESLGIVQSSADPAEKPEDPAAGKSGDPEPAKAEDKDVPWYNPRGWFD